MIESEWEEYILYKKYRSSDSLVIRIIGKIIDISDSISFGIIRAFPIALSLFAALVVIYVFVAIINT